MANEWSWIPEDWLPDSSEESLWTSVLRAVIAALLGAGAGAAYSVFVYQELFASMIQHLKLGLWLVGCVGAPLGGVVAVKFASHGVSDWKERFLKITLGITLPVVIAVFCYVLSRVAAVTFVVGPICLGMGIGALFARTKSAPGDWPNPPSKKRPVKSELFSIQGGKEGEVMEHEILVVAPQQRIAEVNVVHPAADALLERNVELATPTAEQVRDADKLLPSS